MPMMAKESVGRGVKLEVAGVEVGECSLKIKWALVPPKPKALIPILFG
jgi:hypothetical protein